MLIEQKLLKKNSRVRSHKQINNKNNAAHEQWKTLIRLRVCKKKNLYKCP